VKVVNTYVGAPIERIEDLRLLRGKGKFVDDIQVDGLLYGAVLRSSVPHGNLISVDVSAALAMPGVHAVFTAKDIGSPVPTIPVRLFPVPELEPYQQPVIADGKVRYVGEPIAFVVADSPALAEDALETINVEIDPLPPVADIGLDDLDNERDLPEAGELFEGTPLNRALTYSAVKGDVEMAFAQAEYRRRETFYVHRHTGITMETRGVLAEWDEERGFMTVSGAAKVPFANRRILAKLLSLPESAVAMIEGDAGGSYGVRGEFFPEDFLTPFAARALKRPVKWIEDRREHFLAISHARDARCEIEIACRRDGTILGLRGEIRCDVGAYIRTAGTITPRNTGQFIPGPYRVSHVDFRTHVELTNKSPSGTYRGPGRYEADFFRERLLELVAADLGIDRVEFRRRNLVSEAELPYPMPHVTPAPSNTELDSGTYETLLDFCLEKAGWKEKQHLQGREIDGRYHGLAVSCFIEGGAAGPSENAKIEIDEDGDVAVYVGSSTVGQSVETALSQIAADAMEVPFERIKLYHGSTPYVTQGFGSYHSRSTVMGGSAILLCANDLKPLIRAAGATALGIPPEAAILAGCSVTGRDGRSVSFAQLDREGLSVERTFFNSKHTYTYGTHVAHVAVHPGTGHVEVIDYVACEDPGVIVNPLTLHGQALGAIVQGLGGTFLEHLVYDDAGQMLTASFADYLLPLATDFPNIRSFSKALRPSPNNPLGIKGAGEGGIIPVGGLIANAVANALQSFDVQPRSLPLSPPRLWRLLQQARKGRA
jgi:aerobic carbon-monoxide dehydrogenase large subunit